MAGTEVQAQTSMSSGAVLRLLGLATAFAIPIALAAIAFVALEHALEHALWNDLPTRLGLPSPGIHTLLIPAVGGLLVASVYRFLRAGEGHRPDEGMGVAPLPVGAVPGVLVASMASLVAGASLGPEAPLVVLTGGLVMVSARLLRLDSATTRAMALVGLGASFTTLFGALPSWVLMFELAALSGTISVAAFAPGLLGAAIGQLMLVGVGPFVGIGKPVLTFQDLPPYTSIAGADLVWTVAMAILTASLAAVVFGGIGLSRRLLHPLALRPVVILPFAGLLLGLTALILGENGHLVLFSGQAGLGELLADPTALGIGALAIVLVGRLVTYNVSTTSGFLGGAIFPAIFLGGALGVAVHVLVPDAPLPVTASVGMAGMTAALIKVPAGSIVITALLLGDPDLVPLVIVGTVLTYLLTLPLRLTAEPLNPATAPAAEPILDEASSPA